MPPSVGFLEFALTFGVLAGMIWFLNGLWTYRRSRFIADTPQIPIRGTPMGLVNVQGKATGEQRIWSPVSHTPCYFYKVHFEQGHSGRGSSWSHLGMDANGVRFHLEDGTGKIAVDVRLADFSMAKSCEREVSAGRGASSVAEAMSQEVLGGRIVDESKGQALPPATDEELRYYLSRRAGQVVFALAERAMEAKVSWRDREKMRNIIVPPLVGEGSPESPERMAEFQASLLRRTLPQGTPGRDLLERTMSENLKLRADSPESVDDSQPLEAPASDDPKAAQKETQRLAAQADFAQMLTHPELAFAPEKGRFRLKEYCIVPGQEYNIIGTCVENPAPQDEQDRNLIVKGKSEPTFVISDQGRVRAEDALRRRALRMVLTGGAIAVASLGFLLARLGQF